MTFISTIIWMLNISSLENSFNINRRNVVNKLNNKHVLNAESRRADLIRKNQRQVSLLDL